MNKLETIVLENGFTIYLYPDSRKHTTFCQFVTLFGGLTKDFFYNGKEYHMQDGVAHILEHYIVECNDCGNFLTKLGKMQMGTNAATHYQMTEFFFDAVDHVEDGLLILLKGLYSVSFSPRKLKKLKNPIYQEIRGKMNNKFYHSHLLMMDNLFPDSSFRNIGGSLEEVEKTTVEDLEVCYKAFYQPRNQFLVIVGNFHRENILSIIQEFFRDKTFEKVSVSLLKKMYLEVRKKEDILTYPTAMDYVEFSFKFDISSYTPKENLDLDFYIHCFYRHFFGIMSPLYQKLVDQKILTTSIHTNDMHLDSFLVIQIGAYTPKRKEFIQEVLKTIEERKDFDEEKFELEKKDAMIHMILRDEDIMKTIIPFVDNVVLFHYPYLDELKDIQELNYKDYKKMIQKLDFTHYTITIIENPKK